MSLSWTRHRPAKTARPVRGRHAIGYAQPAGGTPDLLKTGPFPAVTPGAVYAPEDFQRADGPQDAPVPAGLDEETAQFRPDFAEEGALERPYAPEPTDPPPAAARLLAVVDGTYHSAAPLQGLARYVGQRTDAEGRRHVTWSMGESALGQILSETSRVEVLDAALEAIGQAREVLVYGGFRAQAAQAEAAVTEPDPDAAEHRDELERELDACLGWARDVLKAAGNLGFLSAALKQRDGEGALNVFVRRAGLANAIDRGDEVAAADAASELVGIVRELCGEAVADSLARGEVPATEAEPEADIQPEAAAAEDEPEPAEADEAKETAVQDGAEAAA